MESQPSLPSIIVISDSEDPCDVDPDECLRGEGILPRETEVDSANARKRRRLTLNSSSDGPFADIAGADDTASDPVEDDYDSDSDGSEFEFESADNSPLRSHPGDGFVQFVTSAFPGDDAHAKGKAFEGFLLNWFLVTYPEYQNKFVKLWSYEAWPKPRDDIVDVDEGIDIIALDTEGKILSPFPATQRPQRTNQPVVTIHKKTQITSAQVRVRSQRLCRTLKSSLCS